MAVGELISRTGPSGITTVYNGSGILSRSIVVYCVGAKLRITWTFGGTIVPVGTTCTIYEAGGWQFHQVWSQQFFHNIGSSYSEVTERQFSGDSDRRPEWCMRMESTHVSTSKGLMISKIQRVWPAGSLIYYFNNTNSASVNSSSLDLVWPVYADRIQSEYKTRQGQLITDSLGPSVLII